MESLEKLIFTYNKKAMDYLRNENFKKSLIYLTKAEEALNSDFSENQYKLLGITFNNFGCLYKRTGNPLLALNYLKKALDLEYKPPIDYTNLAGTHLNMCAILSKIGEHSKAIDHAIKAMNLSLSRIKEDPKLLNTLIVSHHNAGIEYENLGQSIEAKKMYMKGLKITLENFGENHPLVSVLRSSIKGLIGNINSSISPLRSTPAGLHLSRASAPRCARSTSNNPEISSAFKSREKSDTVRYITGERLQPMSKFQRDDFRTREVKTRKRIHNNARSLIKELDGESSIIIEKKNDDNKNDSKGKPADNQIASKIEEDPKAVNVEITTNIEKNENIANIEKISIATQVEFHDGKYFKNVRQKAAVIIQKYIRGFLAKKQLKNLKYESQVKQAEESMKIAKEKLKSLKEMGKSIRAPNKPKEIFPVAYKDKIEQRALRTGTVVGARRLSMLSTIPEENDSIHSKVITIQKHWRGWKTRKNFQNSKHSAIFLQKHIRRYQVKKLYQKIREAIIFIQRTWRLHLKHHKKSSFHNAIKN